MSDEVAIVIDGVELREVGGEGQTVLEKRERMTIYGGAAPKVTVGKTTVPLKSGDKSFTRLGDREYRFPTDDVMTFLFLELPKGLLDVQLAAVAAVLSALSEGRPVPTSAEAVAAPAPAPAAAAVAPAGAAAAAPAAGAGAPAAPAAGIGAMFSALAAKAMHDTKAVGEALRAKAEHDLKLYQDEQAAKKKGGAPA